MFDFRAQINQITHSCIFSYKVQMQFSQDWSLIISSVRCVLKSEGQSWSDEIFLRAFKFKIDPQDHRKDRILSSPGPGPGQVQVRWGSGRSKIDLSHTLFLVFTTTHPPTHPQKLFSWLLRGLDVRWTYSVATDKWNNVWLNCDLSLTFGDFFSPLKAYQVWSIL